MRDIILTLIVLGTVPFVFRNPYWGVLVWNWLAFMSPQSYTWGFAQTLRFSLLIAGATIFALFISNSRKKLPWNFSVAMMLVLGLWVSITTIVALNPSGAVPEWERFTKIVGMIFIAMMVVDTRWKLDGLIWAICLSLGFYGFKGGIFTLVNGGIYTVGGPSGSFIEGNNELAFALVMVLPLMRYLQMTVADKRVQLGIWGMMGLTAVSIVGSYSRGAFLAGGVMALILGLRSRKRFVIITLMILLIPALLSFMPEKWHERMDTIETYQEDASAMGRINAWWFAWNLAKDNPIFGGGANVFTKELFYRYAPDPENHHDVHSIYFEMLGEQGFVGLGIFLCIGISAVFIAQSIRRKTKGNHELVWAYDLASMCQVSMVGYAVGGAFLGLSYWDLPYTIVAIVALTDAFVNEDLMRQQNISTENSNAVRLEHGLDGKAGAINPGRA